jgi:hypothetical protein
MEDLSRRSSVLASIKSITAGWDYPGCRSIWKYIGFACFLCALGRLLALHSFEPKTACGN